MHAYGRYEGRYEFGKKDQTEKKNTGKYRLKGCTLLQEVMGLEGGQLT